MTRCIRKLWNDEAGVLSFEWSLLLALLTIGIVGGLVGARDAITDELGDVAEAMLALDDSYTITSPLEVIVDVDGPGIQPPQAVGGGSNSGFIDRAIYLDCDRLTITNQQ
jgi:Flp pilus assembly pilin Flp